MTEGCDQDFVLFLYELIVIVLPLVSYHAEGFELAVVILGVIEQSTGWLVSEHLG